MDYVYVGRSLYSTWGDCCAKDGGPGTGKCQWDGQEIVRYAATCSSSNIGYGGMAVGIYLHQGEGINVLTPGGSIGFF